MAENRSDATAMPTEDGAPWPGGDCPWQIYDNGSLCIGEMDLSRLDQMRENSGILDTQDVREVR